MISCDELTRYGASHRQLLNPVPQCLRAASRVGGWLIRLCWLCGIAAFSAGGQPMQAADNAPETPTNLVELLNEANELWVKGDAARGIPKYNNVLGLVEAIYGKDSSVAGLVLFRIG